MLDRLVEVAEDAGGRGGQVGGPERRRLRHAEDAHGATRRIGLHAQPGRATRPAPDDPDLVAVQPELRQPLDEVAQAECAALEHRPAEMVPAMTEGQPTEHAAGVLVPARCRRSGQGGDERHAATARRDGGGLGVEAGLVPADDVEEPAHAATGHEPGVLDEPGALIGVAVGLEEARRVDDRLEGGDADRLGRARDVAHDARPHDARPERRSVLVARAHDHPAGRRQTELVGGVGGQWTRDLAGMGDASELVRSEAGRGEHPRRPGAGRDVVQHRG